LTPRHSFIIHDKRLIADWSAAVKCCPPPTPIDESRDPDAEITELAKALGHRMRVRVLRILLEQEECVCGATSLGIC
jgi:hypothetical protein